MKKINQIASILTFLFIGIVTEGVNAQKIVNAADFGVKAGSYTNAAKGIRAAIEVCRTYPEAIIKLPEGRIDVWSEDASKKELYISNSTENDTLSKIRNIAFLLENMKNVSIEGNNTLVVLHGKMISFAFINCSNITLKNLTFDYERPTMSEMTLLSVSDTLIKARIHKDSRYFINKHGQIGFYGEGWKSNAFHTIRFSPEKDQMFYSSFSPFLKARAIDDGCREISFYGKFNANDYHENDVLTVRDPYRDNVGGFINLSKDVRLENINMRYMHGLGIISQFSENLTYFNVEVAPDKTSGRIIASFADCFHFSGCKGQILLDGCHTSGSHDDPVNVHGTHLKVTAVSGNLMTVRFMHHQTYGFEAFFAGDSIAFTNPETLLNYSFGKLKSAKLINKREMQLEIEGGVPSALQIGDCIENLTHNPDVTIRNCRFERTNTRGVLITTRGKVLIENNTFYRTGMHAIFISDDAESWFESGPVRDVTIRNNFFDHCAYNQAPESYVIAIAPENRVIVPEKSVHRNIRIINNRFELAGTGVFTAKSTDNLIFENNKISTENNVIPYLIRLNACTNVKITKNTIEPSGKLEIIKQNMKKKDVKQ